MLKFNKSQWLKPYIKLNEQQIIEAEKVNEKTGKAVHKLINNTI